MEKEKSPDKKSLTPLGYIFFTRGIVVVCKDSNTLEEYEERYDNLEAFEASPTLCGIDKLAHSIITTSDIELNNIDT
jgi:hypothetical protein